MNCSYWFPAFKTWVESGGIINPHMDKDHKYWMSLNLYLKHPYNNLWYRRDKDEN